MSSAGNQPAPPRPSVFISYATEDRLAARAMRDFLTAAGLEVWYDENELGGGDAWDRMIRQQIRDCEYFMPVISQTTERRKEGYFRREWRLAAERTLDMADDVLFLLPVTIDDTSESGARVPEKFLSVQWLRVPGGQPTPALETLSRRLFAGDHRALPRPSLAARTPLVPPVISAATQAPFATTAPFGALSSEPPPAAPPLPPPPPPAPEGPPPMPPFPHAPEKGGVGPWLRFLAEILWWFVTAAWLLFTRLPKWGRVIVVIWLVFGGIGTCQSRSDRGNSPSRSSRKERPPQPPPVEKITVTGDDVKGAIEAARQAMKEATGPGRDGRPPDFNRIGTEIGRRIAQKNALDPNAAGKSLVLAPFSSDPDDPASVVFSASVFRACQAQILAARPDESAVTVVSIGHSTDEALIALGRNLASRHLLGARIVADDGRRSLAVRLIRVGSGGVLWREDFPIDGADPQVVAKKIADSVLDALPAQKKGP